MNAVERVKHAIANLNGYSPTPDELDFPIIHREHMGDRRWGYDEQIVVDVDGACVGVLWYNTEETEKDEWEVYPVKPVQTVTYEKI